MKPFTTLFLTSSIALSAPDTLDTTVIKSADNETLTQKTLEQDRLELSKIPGGTESVDSERYLTGRSSTLADTFALSPGVIAQSRFGSDEARISIRGSGLQRTFHGRGIRFMQDGIPLNLADGGFDMQSVDPLAASHINIWRGGNAISRGSATLGGAIDYLSHTGRSAPGYSARLEAGSYEYLRARFAGGITEGSKDLYFSLSHASQNGFRDHAEQSAQRLFTNFGVQLRDDLETRFYLTAIHTDSDLPGNLTKAQLETNPRQADTSFFGSVPYDNQRNFELFRFANKTTLRSGNNTWDFSAAWTYKDLDHPITPFVGVIDQLSNDLYLGATFTNTDDFLGRENVFRSGLSFTYGETRSALFANNSGSRGALKTNEDQTASNLEFFIENQHHLNGDLSLTTGLSAAYSIRENERFFNATPPALGSLTNYDDSYSNVAPNLGLVYEKNDIQYFTGISGSYEPPSFSEAVTNNIARDAQTAATIEAGTRGTRSFARWDATVYYSKVKDELLTLTDPSTMVSTTTNADDTIHYGIELGTEIDLLGSSWLDENPDQRLVFRSAYTYGSFRFDDDAFYGDNRIAGLPPHLLRSELLWENAQGYYAGPTFEWSPVKSFIDHRNTFAADPYALLGFKVGRRVANGISWFIEAKNLTDEVYSATHGVMDDAGGMDQRQFLPGDGRSVFAGIEWKF
ncbi:TonB-dependent receptor family protein [Luteolibacter algae]|uniref:TonB-dependent receptor family protein n=1 Tax=Luteolibacter algae TaxID=454151 RepID=A0ABW5DA97_9BACT